MTDDKTLVCSDCGKEFVFTAQEQDFFKQKGFEHEPKRCFDCRRNRKDSRSGRPAGPSGPREMHSVTCDQCGKEATVPFAPTPGKPVYCSDCFDQKRGPRRGR